MQSAFHPGQRREERLGEPSGRRSEADGESQASICDGRAKDQPNLLPESLPAVTLTTGGRPVPLESPVPSGWALRESGRQLVWAEGEMGAGLEDWEEACGG